MEKRKPEGYAWSPLFFLVRPWKESDSFFVLCCYCRIKCVMYVWPLSS